MVYDTLCLTLTDKCPARCEFCGLSCGPDKSSVMDADLMKRLIREAKELGFKTVGFSGGEPFLFPELLMEGVNCAKEEGLRVNIATNGFWGAWDDDRITDYLSSLLPKRICFSYDAFHREYISPETFFRAVYFAMSLKIDYVIGVADMAGEGGAGRFVKSLGKQALTREYAFYPAYRTGRGLCLPEEKFLTLPDTDELCCVYEKTLSVMCNGDVYPCCRHQVFETPLKHGNACGQSLAELIKKSTASKICSVMLSSERFSTLKNEAKRLGITLPDKIGCSCDYCRAMFGTKENMEKMLPIVEDLYGQLVIKSLLRG